MHDNGLSLERILALRGAAFAAIKVHAAHVTAIAEATEALDTALQVAIAVRNVDDQQALITSARQLSAAMAGRVA